MGVPATPATATSKLLEGYRPWPGVPDELLDAEGNVRPRWQELLEHVAPLSQEELLEHFARADQYLRDAGVYFRQYSADPLAERDWPLAPIPVILHEGEWQTICAGLAQRADLLERLWRAGELSTADFLTQLNQSLDTAFAGSDLQSQASRATVEALYATGRLDAWVGFDRPFEKTTP